MNRNPIEFWPGESMPSDCSRKNEVMDLSSSDFKLPTGRDDRAMMFANAVDHFPMLFPCNVSTPIYYSVTLLNALLTLICARIFR